MCRKQRLYDSERADLPADPQHRRRDISHRGPCTARVGGKYDHGCKQQPVVTAIEQLAKNEAHMPFRNPHVTFVSFAVEIVPTGTTEFMVVETDLHLNSRHQAYDRYAVQGLIAEAQAYLSANAGHVT